MHMWYTLTSLLLVFSVTILHHVYQTTAFHLPSILSSSSSTSRHQLHHHALLPHQRHQRPSRSFISSADDNDSCNGCRCLQMSSSIDQDTRNAPLLLPRTQLDEVSVVWYTACDLRIHDHNALVASSTGAGVVPFFVFDGAELRSLRPEGVALLYYAVADLKESLQNIGSDLVVRVGDAKEAVPMVMMEAGATRLYHHYSAIHRIRNCHRKVRDALVSSGSGGGVSVHVWRTQLQGEEDVDALRQFNYKDFEKQVRALPLREPFPAPEKLPPLPAGVSGGAMPSLEDILTLCMKGRIPLVKAVMKGQADAEVLLGTKIDQLARKGFGEKKFLHWLDSYMHKGDAAFGEFLLSKLKNVDPVKRQVMSESTEEPAIAVDVEVEVGAPVSDGNKATEQTVKGLEAAAIERIIVKKGVKGLAPGEVFARGFGHALALGCLSPRKVLRAAVSLPLISSSWWSTLTGAERESQQERASMRALVEAMQWHDVLAERDVEVQHKQMDEGESSLTSNGTPLYECRYWRWHGWTCRYAVGGSKDPNAPALLMVHGFGASVGQWKRCFEELGDKYRLYAADLIGFGHCVKPPLTYTQYMWCDYCRDFALNVIGSPFYIAGNSIGGYISMGVAADSRELCKGVILINSAGRLLDDAQWAEETQRFGEGVTVEEATRTGKLGEYSAPPNALLYGMSQLIFSGLQGRIAKTCYSLYPTNPKIVDEGLAEDIYRDSCDPGALGIFASGGKLPFSRSANEMLGKYGGPVLVAQGVLDPLNDAVGRAKKFKEVYYDVRVKEIEAGHCPHEEKADEVARAITDFIESVSSGTSTPSSSSSSSSETAASSSSVPALSLSSP